MPNVRTVVLAGAAAIAVAGLSGVAAARDLTPHVMTVQLPGGGVAEIRYTGDFPPQVVFSPAPTAFGALPPLGAFFGPASPFATLDWISAGMDREAGSLMRQAEMLARAPALTPNQPIEAALGNLPREPRAIRWFPPGRATTSALKASRSPRPPMAADRVSCRTAQAIADRPRALQARSGRRRCPRRRTDPTSSRPMRTAPRPTPAWCVRRLGSTDLDHHRTKGGPLLAGPLLLWLSAVFSVSIELPPGHLAASRSITR